MVTNQQIAPYVQQSVELAGELSGDPQWERLWLSTMERHWRSIAVVPAGPGADDEFSMEVAMGLARTGMAHLGQQIHVADATTLRLSNNGYFLGQMKQAMESGPVIVALAPCSVNPVTALLARSTNGVIMCAKLGAMKLKDASNTLDEIGREHFICAATFT